MYSGCKIVRFRADNANRMSDWRAQKTRHMAEFLDFVVAGARNFLNSHLPSPILVELV